MTSIRSRAEAPCEPEDRSRIAGATVSAESEGRESHPRRVLLQRAGRANRGEPHVEAGAVGVVADQLEVRMRAGAADEVEERALYEPATSLSDPTEQG